MADTVTDPQFIHLHVHSAYSLAEGAIKIPKLLDLCVANDMPAVAITDTNNMFGAMDLSLSAVKKGIQPILGTQLDVYLDEEENNNKAFHKTIKTAPIVLLAQSEQGYKNLCKLISRAYVGKNESGEPTGLAIKEFKDLSEGLICLTGGPDGPLGCHLKEGHNTLVNKVLGSLEELFPNRLYIELMRHGENWDRDLDNQMIELAQTRNLPLVATNNCYFPNADMYRAHDALLCIAGGTYVSQTDRRTETPDHYFKSQEEMVALFDDVPEAIANTVQIAKRCHFILKPIDVQLPASDTAEGRSEAEELRYQSETGLDWRLETYVYTDEMTDAEKKEIHQDYFDRMEMELGIIIEMGFPGYFLIVADFIEWSKKQNIPVGPGRGSGGGSVVAWALKIIDIDPIEYGLLFERFLNPERVSMPDFDIDFCQSRRDEVIQYVQDKYGKDRVAQIITFGKLQARAVVRDVGRVLQMPYGQVDRISKMIPANPANPMTLQEAVDGDPEFARLQKEDPVVERLITIALQLEGLYRHASTHAAGIVIGNKPLEEIVPLYQDARSDMPATQYNLKFVELVSLVKFDFLGLKTLTVLQTAVEYIKETTGDEIDLLDLPMEDKKTYDLMSTGRTTGIFQFEATFIQDVLRKAKPNRIGDLIALTSLNRPGPMDNIPDYIAYKNGSKEIVYPHEDMKDVLEETYGIMVYQEQVMQAAQILAGYTLGGADLLRRAMGKKIQAEMDKQREVFVEGAAKTKNINPKQANEIFDLIAKFAGYGFNKSHAGAYAIISYQTAYLKANYPVEYMAAVMTLDMGNTDKINFYRQDLRRMGIKLLPPNINKSVDHFRVEETEDGKAVRYALAALKGAGQQAMQALVKVRDEGGMFKNMDDFMRRVDVSSFSKKQLEILASAGAFDLFNLPRSGIFTAADHLMRQANQWAAEKSSGQVSLFGASEEQAGWEEKVSIPKEDEWDELQRLQKEFSAVGFYLSAHPLDSQVEVLEKNNFKSFAGVKEFLRTSRHPSARVKVAGVVIKRQEKRSQRGRFAFLTLSDQTGLYDVTVYEEPLMTFRDIMQTGNILAISADATMQDEENIRLIMRNASLLDEELLGKIKQVDIILEDESGIDDILEIFAEKPAGPVKITMTIPLNDLGKSVQIKLNQGRMIQTEDLDSLKRMKNAQISAL